MTFISTYISAQKDGMEKGIKDPRKNFQTLCNDCKKTLKSAPSHLRFGFVVHHNTIFFLINDEDWFRAIFKGKNDGIAADIIHLNQYACKSKNKMANSWAYKGYLLPPMYQKDLFKKAKIADDGTIMIEYATLPAQFNPDSIELNLLLLKNKYLCHYSTFYDLRGDKWNLLDMPLVFDTTSTQNPQGILSTKTLNKNWEITVPFEKNKFEYNESDLKPLHDSLEQNDFIIKKINIYAYSSVEGSLENNIKLQENRAKSIISALQNFQIKTIEAEIEASENWVEFYNDIQKTKYQNWSDKSKEEIKELIKNANNDNNIEKLLANHRKAILKIELEKKVIYQKPDTALLKKDFQLAIDSNNIKKAIDVQKAIIGFIESRDLDADFNSMLQIPSSKLFSPLVMNKEILNYKNHQNTLLKTTEQLEKLKKIDNKNSSIAYNLICLKLYLWADSIDLYEPQTLKNEITSLRYLKFNQSLINLLLMNHQILSTEYYDIQRKYKDRNNCLNYIKINYSKLDLNDEDILRLSKYFVAYYKPDWGIEALRKHVLNLDASEDLIYYYLNLTIVNPKYTLTADYRKIMLNAINRNRTRFCSLFKAFNRGGISFQLLEDKYLKSTFCENCQ